MKAKNPTYVTALMGHGLSVFMKHYKRAVPKIEAEAYFNVLPTDTPQEPAETTDLEPRRPCGRNVGQG